MNTLLRSVGPPFVSARRFNELAVTAINLYGIIGRLRRTNRLLVTEVQRLHGEAELLREYAGLSTQGMCSRCAADQMAMWDRYVATTRQQRRDFAH